MLFWHCSFSICPLPHFFHHRFVWISNCERNICNRNVTTITAPFDWNGWMKWKMVNVVFDLFHPMFNGHGLRTMQRNSRIIVKIIYALKIRIPITLLRLTCFVTESINLTNISCSCLAPEISMERKTINNIEISSEYIWIYIYVALESGKNSYKYFHVVAYTLHKCSTENDQQKKKRTKFALSRDLVCGLFLCRGLALYHLHAYFC